MEYKKGNSFLIKSWPRAFLHIDADAFFASCEQALNPNLKGLPVITGAERGIVSAASYEAKDLGIGRGIPLWEVRKICPDAIILPSDYESYSLISTRMFDIMRRFVPVVEEYSIDEGFADLTGMRRPLHCSYHEIGRRIKEQIEVELGITVSVGIAPTKSLAKIAANIQKPSGLTVVPGSLIENLLEKTPINKVWGFGESTTSYLKRFGIKTAYDFTLKSKYWVKQHLNKTGLEIWNELRGQAVYDIADEKHEKYKSISKTKTFTPPSTQRNYLLGQMIRNLESACIKARRHNLVSDRLVIYLRQQNFQSSGIEIKLDRASNSSLLMTSSLKKAFKQIWAPGTPYRSTGVVLSNLKADNKIQESLFTDKVKVIKMEQLTNVIDIINNKFGKHTLHQASSLSVNFTSRGNREAKSSKWQNLLKGENYRQHLYIPRWSIKAN
ncbi:MAG: DNA polymerase Y family protein [Candidatus Komeilibacteria bacterium]